MNSTWDVSIEMFCGSWSPHKLKRVRACVRARACLTGTVVSSFSHFACFALMCSLSKATVIPNVS